MWDFAPKTGYEMTPLFVYILFIHSSFWEDLGFLDLLAIVTNAALNIAQIAMSCYHFLLVYTQGGVAGVYSSFYLF